MQAAQMLGVNVSTIKRWTDSGILPCHRTAGGHRTILPQHLIEFAENQDIKVAGAFPLAENSQDTDLVAFAAANDFEVLRDLLLREALAANVRRIQLLCMTMLNMPTPLHQIFDDLVSPVLHRIGDLWEQGEISITEEHIASQSIRNAISRLQAYLPLSPKTVGTVLCVNLTGELHDIALVMVATILEKRGFKVIFAGQMTPPSDLKALSKIYDISRLYISTTSVNDPVSTRRELQSLLGEAAPLGIKLYIGGQAASRLNVDEHPDFVHLTSFQQVYEN